MESNNKTEKVKKPFYKKWCFWLIVVVIGIGAVVNSGNSKTVVASNDVPSVQQNQKSSSTTEKKDTATIGQKTILAQWVFQSLD